MADDAIFLVDGEDLEPLTATAFGSEAALQEALARHPELLAGAQIDADAPRRWLLIDREIGVPGEVEGAARFSLDHLFVDQDAIPTLVEVKRATDTRLRRETIGQILDYAANGLRHWPVDELRTTFERRCAAESLDAEHELGRLTGEADAAAFWQRVAEQLAAGRVRLLLVADRIPLEVQTVVEYLNEQLRAAEVLAVELTRYAGAGREVLVPRVIGKTAAATRVKRRSDQRDYEALLADADASTIELDRRLRDLADHEGLTWRTTPRARQFGGAHGSIIALYPPGEAINVLLGEIRGMGLDAEADDVLERLATITQTPLASKMPAIPARDVLANWDDFASSIIPTLLELRARAAPST